MRQKLLLVAFLTLPLAVQGQHQFKVLHAFGSGEDGAGVWDSVTLDAHGNVYGTTSGGGAYKAGTAFRLAPGSNEHWSEAILHSFLSRPHDGAGPLGGVVLGPSGRLYGATQVGGVYSAGTVFEMGSGSRGWKEATLYSFGNHDLACCPWGSLILGPEGDLYGTGGSAFELSPSPTGWTETILRDFTGKNGDGYLPRAGPIMDPAGDLYGTTMYGGGSSECDNGCGTVWELEPSLSQDISRGKVWKERILHRFGFAQGDGAFPGLGRLALDRQRNIYGTTDSGGAYGAGIVFELKHVAGPSGDLWAETILHSFAQDGNGFEPSGGVIVDNAGNLYGTTIAGGSPNCGCGVVFKLSPKADGTWKYTLLHTFIGSDGAQPDANLTLGPDGNLYGTAATGGAGGGGVVFQLTP